MQFSFPWPHPDLSPNGRADRFTKAKRVKAYRTGVAWEAKLAGIKAMGPQRLHLTVTFSAPDMRARDMDNMLSSIKAALDGLSDVLTVDDSLWDFTLLRGPTVKGGRVAITITPAPAAAALIPLRGTIQCKS